MLTNYSWICRLEQIIELNNIKDPDKIGTGTSLILAEDYVVDANVQQNPASNLAEWLQQLSTTWVIRK